MRTNRRTRPPPPAHPPTPSLTSTSTSSSSTSTSTAASTTSPSTSTATTQAGALGRLAVFAAVAEAKSFSVAAERLALPRSSVSKHIAALEAALGAPLLFRTTRKVSLSPAGEALYGRIAPGLAQLQGALAVPVVDDDETGGVIRITAIADFTAAVLKDLIAAYLLRFPGVRIELVLTDKVVDLRGDGIDLAFRFSFGALKGNDLFGKKLGDVHLALYASPSYLARAGTPKSFDELRAHQTVGTGVRFPLKNGTAKQLFRQAPTVVCDDMVVCRALVLAGVGLGVLPGHLVRDDVQRGLLTPVLPQWHAMRGTAWLVSTQKKPPLRVQRFRDFALAQAGDWFR